ncbi:MAG: pacearchaeosortase [Candidatus Pacearchaeota archaeon]|nr:pacearchaeosortase [Candidatus Pacearchaeota archaeon]
MKKRLRLKIFNISLRYLLLILIAVPNLWLFYFVFTPLTVYPVYLILRLLLDATLLGNNVLLLNNIIPIELIRACIAGSAYYLLLILNLSIPDIKIKKRVEMILLSFLALLVLNIIRIIVLTLIFMAGYSFFNLAHEIFWYVLSTIFVVGIWFAEIKIYKIKEIPLYSDIKYLIRIIKK